MAGNERILGHPRGEVEHGSLEQFDIRATDGDSLNLDQDIIRAGLGIGDVLVSGVFRAVDSDGFHGFYLLVGLVGQG